MFSVSKISASWLNHKKSGNQNKKQTYKGGCLDSLTHKTKIRYTFPGTMDFVM